MKAVTPELLALFATRQFYSADLWRITLTSGQVLRYATADLDITAGGELYRAASHLFSRGKVTQKLGLDVATLDVNVYPNETDLVNGVPFFQAVRLGYFDAAEVQVLRAFMPTAGDVSAGTIIWFAGRMGEIKGGRTAQECTVNAHTELLNTKVPRAIYQAPCPFNVFDANCGAAQSAYLHETTVAAGATQTSVPVAITQANGWGAQGIIAFTSGVCAGLSRMIVSYAGNVCQVFPPLPAVPAAGDIVRVSPGCDKSWSEPTNGSLSTTIPTAAPYQRTISGDIVIDKGVVGTVTTTTTAYDSWGDPYTTTTTHTYVFVAVASSPASHQYSVSNGAYTFAAADAGMSIVISYQTVAGTGCGRFNNLARFGGQPYVPAPSTTT